MKVSRQQATENRARVVTTASRLFREDGFEGIGVADIMRSAGLTHGGFYASFESKAELEGEAATTAFKETVARLRELMDGSPDPLRSLVEIYLSPAHRDQPGKGCAIAALAGDATRAGLPLREVFERGVRAYLALLAEKPGQCGDQAMATLSTLVGALTLSRTVVDPLLSDDILRAAAASIIQSSQQSSRAPSSEAAATH